MPGVNVTVESHAATLETINRGVDGWRAVWMAVSFRKAKAQVAARWECVQCAVACSCEPDPMPLGLMSHRMLRSNVS
eukprot:COSAG02_NODE_353_length_24023_cov_77.872304_13_plen_77_part_00